MRTLVLDTNVLVSGILSEHGPPGWIVDLVMARELATAYDSRIIAEYRDVLARTELKLSPERVNRVLFAIQDAGVLVTPLPWPVALPDADDEPFLASAKAAGAPLVTGNLRHYPTASRCGVTVLSPRQFLETLRDRPGGQRGPGAGDMR
ncbi:MAG: putative toxin-antitoxin system toxin component, PIN family [Luteitalea sp.]|nr:putative toxin-antitoxin system toxin component, PIN family [Luteitalea sp.]